ncbi:hypothetical protein AC1031_018576 [Aphanomyces cochlioides]|nr:hypothetical protein AC1031_018576 [Aphanomyces cochlioides]
MSQTSGTSAALSQRSSDGIQTSSVAWAMDVKSQVWWPVYICKTVERNERENQTEETYLVYQFGIHTFYSVPLAHVKPWSCDERYIFTHAQAILSQLPRVLVVFASALSEANDFQEKYQSVGNKHPWLKSELSENLPSFRPICATVIIETSQKNHPANGDIVEFVEERNTEDFPILHDTGTRLLDVRFRRAPRLSPVTMPKSLFKRGFKRRRRASLDAIDERVKQMDFLLETQKRKLPKKGFNEAKSLKKNRKPWAECGQSQRESVNISHALPTVILQGDATTDCVSGKAVFEVDQHFVSDTERQFGATANLLSHSTIDKPCGAASYLPTSQNIPRSNVEHNVVKSIQTANELDARTTFHLATGGSTTTPTNGMSTTTAAIATPQSANHDAESIAIEWTEQADAHMKNIPSDTCNVSSTVPSIVRHSHQPDNSFITPPNESVATASNVDEGTSGSCELKSLAENSASKFLYEPDGTMDTFVAFTKPGSLGLRLQSLTVTGFVDATSPAATCGKIAVGDVIVALNGQPIFSLHEFARVVKSNTRPIFLTFRRSKPPSSAKNLQPSIVQGSVSAKSLKIVENRIKMHAIDNTTNTWVGKSASATYTKIGRSQSPSISDINESNMDDAQMDDLPKTKHLPTTSLRVDFRSGAELNQIDGATETEPSDDESSNHISSPQSSPSDVSTQTEIGSPSDTESELEDRINNVDPVEPAEEQKCLSQTIVKEAKILDDTSLQKESSGNSHTRSEISGQESSLPLSLPVTTHDFLATRTESLPSSRPSHKFKDSTITFGPGLLGMRIGETIPIPVLGFISDTCQAARCGLIAPGDLIIAVNSKSIHQIGIHGFVQVARSNQRPLRVTFRRKLEHFETATNESSDSETLKPLVTQCLD